MESEVVLWPGNSLKLLNRTQQVVLEGVASGTVDVTSGVPQGSCPWANTVFTIHK